MCFLPPLLSQISWLYLITVLAMTGFPILKAAKNLHKGQRH